MILFVFALREYHSASWKLFRSLKTLLKNLETVTMLIIDPANASGGIPSSECAFLNRASPS